MRTALDTYDPDGTDSSGNFVPTPSFTFAGDSLTINNTNGTSGGLIYKGLGTTGKSTFKNLILDGGYIRHASGTGDLFRINGKMTLASTGTVQADQGNINIEAAIGGTGSMTIASDSQAFFVRLASPANTFSGNLNVNGRLELAQDANVKFAVGASGVNNAVTGSAQQVLLNGVFDVDLANAGRTIGNAWNLVTSGNTSYGEGFSLNGFTFNAGQWISDRGYVYSQTTGQLSYVGTSPATVSFSNTSNATQTISANQNFPSQRTTFFAGAGGGNISVTGNISGVGGVAKTGPGTLTLAGTNTYTGSTRIEAGTLSLTGSLNSSSALVMAGGSFVNARAGSTTQTLNGLTVLPGAATVTNNSAGTLALGNITRSSGGTVDFVPTSGPITTAAANTNGILGAWAFVGTGANTRYATNTAGTVTGYTGATASTTFGYTTDGTVNYEVSGIGGPFGSSRDANTVRYTGAAGAVTTNSTQTFNFNGLLNAGTGALTLGGGGFTLNVGAGSTGELVLAAANAEIIVSGPVIDGANGTALTIVGPNTVTLAGTNTYSGKTMIAGGTLAVSGGVSIPDAGAVELGPDANLTFAASETIGSLAGRGNVTIASGTLALGGSNASTTFRGNISGAGLLTKTGAGTLFLSGSNTYAGNTSVNQGAISVNSMAALGTGSVINLGSGAGVGTLVYTGTGDVTSKSIFQSAGAAANGGTIDMSGTGLLRFTGATLAANTAQQHTLTLQGSTTGIGQIDGVISNGTATNKTSVLKQGTGTWILKGANTYTGTTTVTAGTLQATTPAYTNLLANAGGVDLQTQGKLVLDYTGGSSPMATVKSILNAGYAGNFASGQIRSTVRAAGQTLGYGDNGAGNVTVRITLPGDSDLDGDVDFNDFLALQSNFGNAGTRFDQGNFNYDGATNFNDFLLLQSNFGQSVGFDAAAPQYTADQFAAVMAVTSAGQVGTTVPEPAGLSLLGVSALSLLRRRRYIV
ncbi:MAG: autotransporter-associated beta strand repeat-containing protein [Tepidisphaeraceae bacterium]